MKAFSDWAPRYARHGVATFPVSGKKPAVSNYLRIGIKATDQLAAKFASAESFGFALKRNRIALVDIDTSDPRALEVGLDQFGPSPLVVRTQSGGHHVYYRRSGEGRRIRAIRCPPIDILGEGFAIAAPSALGRKGATRSCAAASTISLDCRRCMTMRGMEMRVGWCRKASATQVCGRVACHRRAIAMI